MDIETTVNSYNTVFKQNTKFKSEKYVKPIEIRLNSDHTTVYIPLIESLKLLLSHEDVLAYVLQSNNSNNEKNINSLGFMF